MAQPTPVFEGSQPTPASRSASARGEQASNSAGVDDLQARLATRVAESRGVDAPAATPTRRPLADLRSAASASVLNRPTALGIVAGGANLAAVPNGTGIGFLPAGATVTITGRSADGGWYAVYLEDSTAGWLPVGQVWVFGDVNELEIVDESIGPAIVATRLAEASRPLGAIEIAAVTPVPRAPVSNGAASAPVSATGPSALVLAEGLNVRAGPGTDYPVIGAYAQNERVTLLARNEAGDWVEIALPGGSGWVYAPLVQPDNPVVDLPVSNAASRLPVP